MNAAQAAQDDIRRVIDRYFYGIDSGDEELVLSVFTEDARYEFAVEQIVLRGRAELTRMFGRNRGPAGRGQLSCHTPASRAVRIRGDTAFADTFATAHLVGGIAGKGRALVRGIRYLDDLRRGRQGWLISHRRHNSLWQYEVQCTSPDLRAKFAGSDSSAGGGARPSIGDENGR